MVSQNPRASHVRSRKYRVYGCREHQRGNAASIPILVNDFRFKDEEKYLTGTLTALARFNGLTLPHEYFDAGMDKLRNRFLTLPVQVEVADTPQPDQPVVQQKIAAEQNFSQTIIKER